MSVGSRSHGLGHWLEEILSAVGIDGVIARVRGNGDGLGPQTFGVTSPEG